MLEAQFQSIERVTMTKDRQNKTCIGSLWYDQQVAASNKNAVKCWLGD